MYSSYVRPHMCQSTVALRWYVVAVRLRRSILLVFCEDMVDAEQECYQFSVTLLTTIPKIRCDGVKNLGRAVMVIHSGGYVSEYMSSSKPGSILPSAAHSQRWIGVLEQRRQRAKSAQARNHFPHAYPTQHHVFHEIENRGYD